MQPIGLNIVPDRNGLLCGVVAINIDVRNLPNRSQKLFLKMTANDNDSGVLETLQCDQTGNCRVFLYTHLIPDGSVSIRIEILNEQDSIVGVGIRDFQVGNYGEIAQKIRRSLIGKGTAIFTQKLCDSSFFDYADSSLQPWFDRKDAFEVVDSWVTQKKIDTFAAEKLRTFLKDGYLILENVLPVELIDQCNREVDEAVAAGFKGYVYGSSQRIEHMHENYPGFREIWRNAEIHKWLSLIFQEVSVPCQSLTYVFGSQQDAHQDTIHLTPFPAGYMCGVWVALQDIEHNSGELVVYRGSHRLPRVYMKDVGCEKVTSDWGQFGATVVARWKGFLEEGKFERVIYRPQKGTVLIWHENLMHGGSIRIDQSLPRRSVVTHNFARGVIVYYDSTGIAGHVSLDGAVA